MSHDQLMSLPGRSLVGVQNLQRNSEVLRKAAPAGTDGGG